MTFYKNTRIMTRELLSSVLQYLNDPVAPITVL